MPLDISARARQWNNRLSQERFKLTIRVPSATLTSSSEMATKEPSSSSYANVVQPIGGPALPQKGLHENNKENQPAATTPAASPGSQDKSAEEPSSKPAEEPVADDSEFTPVIGNNKKERKPRKEPPKAAAGTKEKPRRNRRDRKGSRDKNKEKEKLEKQEEKSAESSDGQPEAVQKDKEVKFVEAPIPKVNAWNVSISPRTSDRHSLILETLLLG